MKYNFNKGFTLIEMAIVVVVIGIIIGAVYGGKSLADSTKRNAMISDIGKYSQAYEGFREKYRSPPGDYKYKILSAAGSEDCTDTIPNGNGRIDGYNGLEKERFCAWRHLTQGGFIQGNYAALHITDAPRAQYEGVIYSFKYFSIPIGDAGYGYSDALLLGMESPVDAGYESADNAFISPQEASLVDKKMDDGLPWQGHFFASAGNDVVVGSNCVGGFNPADEINFYKTATYILDEKEATCTISYLMDLPRYHTD
jgi:prepilin-type N-terminal cleavage/methylation domain-containing protein